MTTTPPPDEPSYPSYPSGDGSQPAEYPVHPGTPAQPSAAASVPQPPSIVTAVRLMWAGAAISVISLIYSLATLGSLKDDIRDRLVQDNANVSQSTIDAAYGVAIGFAIVFGAIGVLIWLWMAWKNGQGRSWARIVATVLAGLNVLFTLLGFLGQDATAVSTLFSVINLVIAIAILVLLWRKESSDFYTARSARAF